MTSDKAKEILLLYRPGTTDREDPEIAAAIEQVARDPKLKLWFEQHQRFQIAIQAALRQIRPPERLKHALVVPEALLAPKRISPSIFIFARRSSSAIAASAALLVCIIAFIRFWLQPNIPDHFGDYRDVIVSKALRGYLMEWEGNNFPKLGAYLAARGGPTNYTVTAGLQKLQLTGGAALTWRNNPVSLICFSREDAQLVFLFVISSAALKDPPATSPVETKVRTLLTASWRLGETTYVLASPADPSFERYLPPR